MKKTVKFFALAAAMPLACFCTKTEEPASNEVVTISAEIPETKVSVNAGTDPALTLAWEQTDKITVKGTTTSEFSVAEIKNSHSATFTGTAVSGTSFNVYYPSADVVSRSYEGQVQNGNASTAHLKFNAMAEGLSSYENVTFTKVNGAIKLVVKVPAEVTAVSSLSITSLTADGAEQAVFYKTNDAAGEKTSTLTLGFSDGTAPADSVLTAYEMVSWNPVELAAGSKLAVKIAVPGTASTYTKTIKLTSAVTVSGGKTLVIDMAKATVLQHVLAGAGIKADPYLIYNEEDLLSMHEACVSSGTAAEGCVYFKMMNDVDLGMTKDSASGWEPINVASPYDKKVDFDGNGKTIKNLVSKNYTYASFLGVVNGNVYNVTFDSCYIEGGFAIGVVGGYCGTTGLPAVVKGVKATNCVVNNTNGSKHGVGGLFGRICEATIDGCSFEGTIYAVKNYTGGIFGYDAGVSTVSNCLTSGLISTTGQRAGGIAGGLIKADSKIKNCFSSAAIYSTSICIGGIAAHCNLDKSSEQSPNNEISGCIAWNDSLSVRKSTAAQYSSGAVVGFTSLTNVLNNCYRKNGLKLIIDDADAAELMKMSNHDGSYSSSNPLPANCDFKTVYIAKYDGKEAEAGITPSAIAKTIGWDETIWDLTGTVPTIK